MKRKRAPSGYAVARKIGAALPGVEEGTCFGTPALRVRGTLLARLREDGETLVLKCPFDDRDVLMQLDPETFFLTDHYRPYPCVLVRLRRVKKGQLEELLERAWRQAAPKRLVAARDHQGRAARARPARRSRV